MSGSGAPTSPATYRVLLVDDNLAIHADFGKIFRQRSASSADLDALDEELFGETPASRGAPSVFLLTSAQQGEEALRLVTEAKASGEPFALAFVDIRMPPGWDGVETVCRLWQVDPTLQVVICTAHSDYTFRDIVERLGLSDGLLVIKKPFDAIEVVQAAHALTRKWWLQRRLELQMQDLQAAVHSRTRELEVANQRLRQEIGERQRAEDNLQHLATHDGLTGLPNRLVLQSQLQQALAAAGQSGRMVALLLFDLDGFKEVNDRHGHQVGDGLLRDVAARLRARTRPEDLIARLGGDEFVMVAGGLERPEEATLAVARVLGAFETAFDVEGHLLPLTTSIGVSLFPRDGSASELLLRHADQAMYRAKQDGKARACYFAPPAEAGDQRLTELLRGVTAAIEQRQLAVHYLPLIDLESGRLKAMEALVRWHHPELGDLAPSTFLHVAERSSAITTIGDWVLREACRQNRAWQEAGHVRVPVAVNLSTRQLQEPELLSHVRAILEETHLAAEHLQLEVTESTILAGGDRSQALLVGLHDLGVRIIIDDFGSGHATFNRLRDLPVHAVKIDRLLLKNIADDPQDASIVAAIVAVAHTMRLEVIAEGIETLAQLESLRRLSWDAGARLLCDGAQGYLFSRPLAPGEATELVARGRLPFPEDRSRR